MTDRLYERFPWLKGIKSFLTGVSDNLERKEESYEGSWQKRGGVGAFMMLARKWDRIEAISARHGYDLFSALRDDDSGITDDVDDLISYLTLCRCHPDTDKKQEKVVPVSGMEHPFGYNAEDERVPDPMDSVVSPRLEAAGVVDGGSPDKEALSGGADAGDAGGSPPDPAPQRHALSSLPLQENCVRIMQRDTGSWADIPGYVWLSNKSGYVRDGWTVIQSSSKSIPAPSGHIWESH